MATYKNRPPMDSATELRRYVPFVALERMLRDRQLRLTRVDQFRDPFEGSVPKRQIDEQVAIFRSPNATRMMAESMVAQDPGTTLPRSPYRDPWAQIKMRRAVQTRSTHVSCWTAGPESEAIWRLYCEDGVSGQGVALCSTLGKVEASVARHDLIVSPVTYRRYHEGPAFNDELDPFMHKRLGFKHECEVRLLSYNGPHYLVLGRAVSGGDGDTPAAVLPPELPVHIFLDWNPLDIADAITVSPYATEDYEQRVRAAVTAIDSGAADLIALSVLSERRYGALI